MSTTLRATPISVRTILLLAALTFTALSAADCTYYSDPRAQVIVTSNRDRAGIYLVPTDVQLPKAPTRAKMEEFAVGTTSSTRGIWIHHGRYWLVLESDGTWSQPVEFEVRLDYLNKVHVEF
jgi:hypothetical protein